MALHELWRIGIPFILAVFLFVGTPAVAELTYELYHLTGFEPVYTAYTAARYLSANYMQWPTRWLPSAILIFMGVVWGGVHFYRSRTTTRGAIQ